MAAAAARNVEEVVHTCASRARGGAAPLPQAVIDGLTGALGRRALPSGASIACLAPRKSLILQMYLPGRHAWSGSWRLATTFAADSTSCCS